MLGVWGKILVGLQYVRPIAHRRQVLNLFPENYASLNRPAPTDKAEDLAKDGVYC